MLWPWSCSSAQPKTGTMTMRRVVRAFGTFQLLGGAALGVAATACAGCSLGSLIWTFRSRRTRRRARDQVDTLRGHHDGLDHVTHPGIRGHRGQDGAAVDLRALTSSTPFGRVAVEGLQQDLDPLAD